MGEPNAIGLMSVWRWFYVSVAVLIISSVPRTLKYPWHPFHTTTVTYPHSCDPRWHVRTVASLKATKTTYFGEVLTEHSGQSSPWAVQRHKGCCWGTRIPSVSRKSAPPTFLPEMWEYLCLYQRCLRQPWSPEDSDMRYSQPKKNGE
jgi:hypothetical protein